MTPGPSFGVDPAPAPNNNTDLQVATSGVYEISMNILVLGMLPMIFSLRVCGLDCSSMIQTLQLKAFLNPLIV